MGYNWLAIVQKGGVYGQRATVATPLLGNDHNYPTFDIYRRCLKSKAITKIKTIFPTNLVMRITNVRKKKCEISNKSAPFQKRMRRLLKKAYTSSLGKVTFSIFS